MTDIKGTEIKSGMKIEFDSFLDPKRRERGLVHHLDDGFLMVDAMVKNRWQMEYVTMHLDALAERHVQIMES